MDSPGRSGWSMLSWRPAGQPEASTPRCTAASANDLTGTDMRFLRFLPLPVLLAVVVLAAGCGSGGGTKSVPSNAVAVVGDATITKTEFNTLLKGAKRNYAARKTPFPKVGTPQYKSLQDQVIQYLVQQSELKQKAKDLGITISDNDVATKLRELKAQYFGSSEKKYQAALMAQGVTEKQLKQQLYSTVLSDRIFKKVTAKVKVSDADVKKYYDEHKQTYTQAASRDVRHILVKSKPLADRLESQLKGGASFAKLARKYSKDPGSAAHGGKLTITKGQTVPPFDKAAFSLKTGQTSAPVHTTYGWHIIQALSAVKAPKTSPLKSETASIRAQLLQTKKTEAMTSWFNSVKSAFAKKIAYQTGYAPAATTTTATTTTQ
jgi:parvulin-like peptidyl-prolyl isomerase